MNWGKSITLVFITFATGIGYLVYRATQTQFELVEDNYYEQELTYQTQINQSTLAAEKQHSLKVAKENNVISLRIEGCEELVTSVDVWFYDAQNRANDRKFKLQQSDSAYWEIPFKQLGLDAVNRGSYEVKAVWITGRDTMRGMAHL